MNGPVLKVENPFWQIRERGKTEWSTTFVRTCLKGEPEGPWSLPWSTISGRQQMYAFTMPWPAVKLYNQELNLCRKIDVALFRRSEVYDPDSRPELLTSDESGPDVLRRIKPIILYLSP